MTRMVYYSGDVQGVGFRATAAWIARRHPIRGWVRNLADGRVQLLAEGSAEAVDAFLDDLRDRMREHILNEDAHPRDSENLPDGFHIVH